MSHTVYTESPTGKGGQVERDTFSARGRRFSHSRRSGSFSFIQAGQVVPVLGAPIP